MKKGRLGAYVRDGMSVEIVEDESCSRDKLIERGRDALKLETHEELELALFTTSGAMIMDEKWKLGDHIKRVKKSEAKVGIGYIDVTIDILVIFIALVLVVA